LFKNNNLINLNNLTLCKNYNLFRWKQNKINESNKLFTLLKYTIILIRNVIHYKLRSKEYEIVI